jgi:hypothetical protein
MNALLSQGDDVLFFIKYCFICGLLESGKTADIEPKPVAGHQSDRTYIKLNSLKHWFFLFLLLFLHGKSFKTTSVKGYARAL